MKSILEQTTSDLSRNALSQNTFRKTCAASCKKALATLQHTRRAIFREFKDSFNAPAHLLRLALNEAEAVAWQTEFPQLIFPTLATEKAQAAVAWHERQQARRAA